jgi:hypothetical protein
LESCIEWGLQTSSLVAFIFTSCGIKIKSEKKLHLTNVLKLLMNFMNNCVLIEVMISLYGFFSQLSSYSFMYLHVKKVLKEASNIVHNNIKRGEEGFVLWKVDPHPKTPITLLNIMLDSIM